MYTISPKAILSGIYSRPINNIHLFNSLSFYYLKAPILKRILKSTFIR